MVILAFTLQLYQLHEKSAYSVTSLIQRWGWVSKTGRPQYLITDKGTEDPNSEMAICCTPIKIRHSLRCSYAPRTNRLVQVQKNHGTHLRMFLHDTPEKWSVQIDVFLFAHNSQPLSFLLISLYEEVFHAQPRIPLSFQTNLSQSPFRE